MGHGYIHMVILALNTRVYYVMYIICARMYVYKIYYTKRTRENPFLDRPFSWCFDRIHFFVGVDDREIWVRTYGCD